MHTGYPRGMGTRTKTKPRKSIPQSVTRPPALAKEVRHVAEAEANLEIPYRRFLDEKEPARNNDAGRDLIQAIFGKHSIAEDPIL